MNTRNRILFSLFSILLCSLTSTAQIKNASNKPFLSERLSFDKAWRFHLGDIPFPEVKGHGMTYSNAKAGQAWGAANANYDDQSWRQVNLPHDWVIEGPVDSTANISQGYRKRGFGWYRRRFRIEPSLRGKHFELQFDGIATYATIWVNGSIVHRNWCGYTSSYIDLTPFLKYGDDLNNIAVRVDAQAQEGWWHEGGGIYRHTYLVVREPLHIETDGLYANPVKKEGDRWSLPAEVTIYNSGKTSNAAEVELQLIDAAGKLVKRSSARGSVDALSKATISVAMDVDKPRLWDIDAPVLYTVKAILKSNGKVVDTLRQHCGFRSYYFDANTGFHLNGRHVKIKGVCNHQDHAGVGVAIPDALWEFRMRKLKELGVNAYRCAHNPPSKELLDLADKLGIMVMDENRNFNSSPEYIRQLQWLVRRDRSRASVIMWSVFNEEPMQGTEIGYEIVRRLAHEVKVLDNTRPVTAAMNGGLFNPINVSKAVDLVGFNYQTYAYDDFHKANPTLPMTSSEDISAFSIRGEYRTDKARHIIGSYDEDCADWGNTHRDGWKKIAERPYLAGGFVWTGFDYHGEPTPLEWPTSSSVFGIMDLCGFPKVGYYIHQAHWIDDKPVLHLIPHWNWPDSMKGKPVKVMAMSNAERLELYLNNKLVGKQKVDRLDMNTWMVPYVPGRLEVRAFTGNREVARKSVETTSKAVRLELIPYKKTLLSNGTDATTVTVRALDAKGREVPDINTLVKFSLSGPASIVGLGNGDPNSREAEQGNERSLFNGLAQVILQHCDTCVNGPVVLRANAVGLKSTSLTIAVDKAEVAAFVPAASQAMILDQWLISRESDQQPDVTAKIAENDMNTWAPYKPGQLQSVAKDKYIMLRTSFVPYTSYSKEGARILFNRVKGDMRVFLDGRELSLSGDASQPFVVMPPAEGQRVLVVLLKTTEDKAGFGSAVKVVDK